jgi:DNA-binding MarR family transcriptional regulator
MRSLDATTDDLLALGLDRAEAAVLTFVISAEEATVGQIRAATSLTPTRTSTAITALMRRGLLDRVQRRRPSVVFIHAHAEAGVRQLRDAAEARREVAAAQANRGAESLLAAARGSAARGRPLHEVRPSTDLLSPDYDVVRLARDTHDQVARLTQLLLDLWVPPLRCRTRLLLVTPDDWTGPVDISALRRRVTAWAPRRGFEARITHEQHVELQVLDSERVGLLASTDQGRAQVWSREPAHARAAVELFGLWWRTATPLLEVSPRVPRDTPDPEYDVEEWDPAD